ncbi:MBL fold metallo-hydrolase [Bacillus timonensis]|uniref:MBL fold metallo-hydrolase n=1 Tax=Bacillus timonensis TaxID=1033734 RepID=UPI0002899F67|nr:MBL fold metallo-hydrolase [Bacillus timonensis]
MEVHQGFHRIEVPYQNRYLYQHILIGNEKLLIIDTGINSTPEEVLLPYLNEKNINTNLDIYILITHCDADHCGGASVLKKYFPNAKIMAHQREVPYLENPTLNLSYRYGEFESIGIKRSPKKYEQLLQALGEGVKVDIELNGNEKISLSKDWEVKIINSPGHTAGHVLVYDSLNKCAIITDAVLGNAILTRTGKKALCPTYRYTNEYLRTIEIVRELNVNILYTSHFPIIDGKQRISDFLNESREYVFLVEKYIHEKMKQNGELTLKLLIEEADDSLSPTDRKIDLYYCLQGGLERIKEQGLFELIKLNGQEIWKKCEN